MATKKLVGRDYPLLRNRKHRSALRKRERVWEVDATIYIMVYLDGKE
jgi:hypothetical protein